MMGGGGQGGGTGASAALDSFSRILAQGIAANKQAGGKGAFAANTAKQANVFTEPPPGVDALSATIDQNPKAFMTPDSIKKVAKASKVKLSDDDLATLVERAKTAAANQDRLSELMQSFQRQPGVATNSGRLNF